MSGANVCSFWQGKQKADGKYECKCGKMLAAKEAVNGKPENKGRFFVSCDPKAPINGCNLFCFVDEEPKVYGGARFGGKAAAAPSSDAKAIADLKAEVATLTSQFATLTNDMNVLRALVAQKPKHRSPKRESADEHSEHSNDEAARKKKSSKKTH